MDKSQKTGPTKEAGLLFFKSKAGSAQCLNSGAGAAAGEGCDVSRRLLGFLGGRRRHGRIRLEILVGNAPGEVQGPLDRGRAGGAP